MAAWKLSRRLGSAVGGLVVAAGTGVWLLVQLWPGSSPGGMPADASGFFECASQAGLTWRMHFLPNEQGEHFKINLYDHGSGLAVGDFDGDGRDDIYFCNQLGVNALYQSQGDGTFVDVAQSAGVALGDRVSVAATFADYDNDGRPDLFVTSTRGGNVLFRNLGGGKFRDVTHEAGVSHAGHSQSALFFDYDNDGFLDLLVTNTAHWTSDAFDDQSRYWLGKDQLGGVMVSPKESNILYHNVPVAAGDPGQGRKFVDVTAKAGLTGRGWSADAVAFDYNDDGLMDVFVTCMFGRCQLYRNNGNGTFTEVTLEVLGRTPWGAIGARPFDCDNDGRLDLYVVDMHSDMWMGPDREHRSLEAAEKGEKKRWPHLYGPRALRDRAFIDKEKEFEQLAGFKRAEVVYGNAFYHNQGQGRFLEVAERADLETFWPWGITSGDYDNDGFEDIFVPSGMGYPFYYWPNYLLMNQGNVRFRNRARKLGIEPPARGQELPDLIGGTPAVRSSRCAAVADFRGAGVLDIVTNNFNDQPYYFKNCWPSRNYIQFRLRGSKSNRDAIGAVIRLYRGKEVLTRQVHASAGYLSQSSLVQHFGLGDGTDIDRVEITWPNSRRDVQTIRRPLANRLHVIVEGEDRQR